MIDQGWCREVIGLPGLLPEARVLAVWIYFQEPIDDDGCVLVAWQTVQALFGYPGPRRVLRILHQLVSCGFVGFQSHDLGVLRAKRFDMDIVGALAWSDLKRPRIPPELRARILERDGHACKACGSTDRLEIDHIHPLARFGTNYAGNLQVLCHGCNAEKRDRFDV